jgi:serine/threonine protein phosphatase PrpC
MKNLHAQLLNELAYFSNAFSISEQVMSNQEAVDCIKHIKDSHSAAKNLVEEALSRKSKDDISCIVVRFR